MPLEIELKLKVDEHETTRQRLEALGARRIAMIHECNTFLDRPGGKLRQQGQGLRVRLERRDDDPADRVIITHKGPRAAGMLKSREETELHVASAEDAIALLRALGFETTLTFEKRRERWGLDGCHIELDTLPIPDLGTFVEIEGPGEQAVLALRDRLGLAGAPVIHQSYARLLGDYAAAHGLGEAEASALLRFSPS